MTEIDYLSEVTKIFEKLVGIIATSKQVFKEDSHILDIIDQDEEDNFHFIEVLWQAKSKPEL